jgi:hypothetical protein
MFFLKKNEINFIKNERQILSGVIFEKSILNFEKKQFCHFFLKKI